MKNELFYVNFVDSREGRHDFYGPTLGFANDDIQFNI